ncbi:Mbeg1-like protein [Alicyclobacillus fructus]|uniref:Mbeg1-like protein n=1 Tax=Alicyclobacillus fructus TaxID=2816082 RepID=UPI001A8DF47D|nr:Mbeg1-like protein [Alicyclobacillus fructus]
MRSPSFWKRLFAFTAASAMLVVPFRFLTVNAVVRVPVSKPSASVSAISDVTDGIYDGVLMKMTDLSYVNLADEVGQSFDEIEQASLSEKGPDALLEEIRRVNRMDWHEPYDEAVGQFFSDLRGWRVLAVDNEEAEAGFYAVAYAKGADVVISYRGTTNNVMDLVADAGIYLSVPNVIDQLKPAKSFFEAACAKALQTANAKEVHVILTGHSMGGWLAQSVYLEERKVAGPWDISGVVVFNSIGTGFQPMAHETVPVKDYHFDGDVFSRFGTSLGEVIDVPNPNPDASVYDKHQMYEFYHYFYPYAEGTSSWNGRGERA